MRVAGLIFDSGWGSATNVAATVPQAEAQEMYLSLLKKISRPFMPHKRPLVYYFIKK